MVEKEIEGKEQIYHIVTSYYKPPLKDRPFTSSGHMVKALSAQKALDIANRHNIGNPMGVSDNVKYRRVWEDSPYSFSYSRRRKGQIWYEDKNGNLKSIDKEKNND